MKQEEKSKETKRRVQKSAAKLFSEKGYEQTTLREIIDLSGTSKGAIYHQYKSKQDILEAIMIEAQSKILVLIKSLRDNNTFLAKEKIMHIVKYLNESITQKNLIDAGWVEKIPFSLLDTLRYSIKEFSPLLVDIIKQGVENKEFSCPRPDLAAEFMIIYLDIWLDPNIFHWTAQGIGDRVDFLFGIMAGIAPGMVSQNDTGIIKTLLANDMEE